MTTKSMTESNERRATGIERISLTTLIDICGLDEAATPFQAESDNISGRGMRVRTSHLPEIGEDLVCRFEREGNEILVEGKVAWRSESEESGEFGVQFTALDAASAEILQTLERSHSSQSSAMDDQSEEEHLESGDRVRMHISGLAAPMKAAVVDGNERKLRVGSSLEFLKIGQNLELEDQKSGECRGARVDMVNVVVNPATAIPELVVQLRYEGAEVSPPPPQAHSLEPNFDDVGFSLQDAHFDGQGDDAMAKDAEGFEAEPERWEPAAEVLRERLGGAASTASDVAKAAGGLVSKWASHAGSAASHAAEQAQAHLKSIQEKKSKIQADSSLSSRRQTGRRSQVSLPGEPVTVRRSQRTSRRTRTASAHLRSGIHDLGLTSQNRSRISTPISNKQSSSLVNIKRQASLGLGALALLCLTAWAINGMVSGSESSPVALQTEEQLLKATEEKGVERVDAPVEDAPTERRAQPRSRVATNDEIVADIPLFGRQKISRTPALSRGKAVETTSGITSGDSQEQGSQEFSSGKLMNPTVHRIRLDGAGEQLVGSADAQGFSISVPRRKTMESGRSIERSDRRIDHVKTINTSQGTRVSFTFSTAVPSYRVSLRNDYIEFAISAPAGSVTGL